MKIYCDIDENHRIIGFGLEMESFHHSAELDTEIYPFEMFSQNYLHYVLNNGVIEKNIDLDLIRAQAKQNCLAVFDSYVFALNEYTKEELYINSIMLNEIYQEVENNASTPVTDLLAQNLGIKDIRQFKLDKRAEIEHFNYALTYLVAQKQQMFNFIDNCEDPNILEEMQFNFSFATYSNMRLI